MRAGRSGRRRPETFLVFLRVLPLSESLNKNAHDLRSSGLNLNPEILFRVYLLTLNPAAAAALRAARSARRMRYSKYAGVSLSSFSQTHNGPLWAALLKTTVRCDATCRSLLLLVLFLNVEARTLITAVTGIGIGTGLTGLYRLCFVV